MQRARIRNRGTEASGPYTYRWSVDGQVVKSATSASIPAGSFRWVSFRTRYRPFSELKFEVDPEGAIASNYRAGSETMYAADAAVERSVAMDRPGALVSPDNQKST